MNQSTQLVQPNHQQAPQSTISKQQNDTNSCSIPIQAAMLHALRINQGLLMKRKCVVSNNKTNKNDKLNNCIDKHSQNNNNDVQYCALPLALQPYQLSQSTVKLLHSTTLLWTKLLKSLCNFDNQLIRTNQNQSSSFLLKTLYRCRKQSQFVNGLMNMYQGIIKGRIVLINTNWKNINNSNSNINNINPNSSQYPQTQQLQTINTNNTANANNTINYLRTDYILTPKLIPKLVEYNTMSVSMGSHTQKLYSIYVDSQVGTKNRSEGGTINGTINNNSQNPTNTPKKINYPPSFPHLSYLMSLLPTMSPNSVMLFINHSPQPNGLQHQAIIKDLILLGVNVVKLTMEEVWEKVRVNGNIKLQDVGVQWQSYASQKQDNNHSNRTNKLLYFNRIYESKISNNCKSNSSNQTVSGTTNQTVSGLTNQTVNGTTNNSDSNKPFLTLDGYPISITYFRSLYQPHHYSSPKHWHVKLILSMLGGIVVPDITMEVVNMKRVQVEVGKCIMKAVEGRIMRERVDRGEQTNNSQNKHTLGNKDSRNHLKENNKPISQQPPFLKSFSNDQLHLLAQSLVNCWQFDSFLEYYETHQSNPTPQQSQDHPYCRRSLVKLTENMLNQSDRYYLKPNADGGGNNLTGPQLKQFIANITQNGLVIPNTPSLLQPLLPYSLMETIEPHIKDNTFLLSNYNEKYGVPNPCSCIMEVSVFGGEETIHDHSVLEGPKTINDKLKTIHPLQRTALVRKDVKNKHSILKKYDKYVNYIGNQPQWPPNQPIPPLLQPLLCQYDSQSKSLAFTSGNMVRVKESWRSQGGIMACAGVLGVVAYATHYQ